MNTKEVNLLNTYLKEKSAQEIVEFSIEKFGVSNIILASSLSIEDQVLTDMFMKAHKDSRIFFIDTGRHFQSTYDLLQTTIDRYPVKFEIYVPNAGELEKIVNAHGPNLFYQSVELRKKCCEARKNQPLHRALNTVEAWACGLRAEQSPTRQNLNVCEWDNLHEKVKINPLAYWSEKQVWEYIHAESIPYNRLYKKNYTSIGCQPCTRAITPGDDIRSGRWWWENPDNKECGLHARH